MNLHNAEQLLQTSLADPNAKFRHGQWEAIDALVNQRQKLLIVQRTGWGKSAVYFISTKIFRDQGKGPTLIISPLLSLMRNQIDAAKRLGLNAVRWDSTNKNEQPEIIEKLKQNTIDVLFIHPKQFSNQEFLGNVLTQVSDNIGLMVVDEAHCISDWGHDFIPEYRLITNILKQLPANTGVLGTTATANDRVVQDIQEQLGNVQIQRGPLIRKSLGLQTLLLPDQASRLAWLAQVIPTLPGTGIIYTLTTYDAEQVANWLIQNNIDAKAYHSNIQCEDFDNSNNYRQHLEELLLKNQLKVLVATTALGMGYDKPDLSFVIHYQAPASVVAYYQQVGRAGRGIDYAVGILMSGNEDKDIHQYFRESAFLSEVQINEILNVLAQYDGLSIRDIEAKTNLSHGDIEKILKFLSVENPSPILKLSGKWHRTAILYSTSVRST
ncbi:ATP-dependent DNA helicase RecQ [Xenorhabdus griffiniae]|nr:ATP-dependent DNA helicase RecQ [Xenorhabdus griffiniae]MBE8588849.1 ATP-dependent DNA helicase RecQ [Xenorhabdus griffiniae]